MTPSIREQRIREALRLYDSGMTIKELKALVTGWSEASLTSTLEAMPDAYIDRWEPVKQSRHKYVPVWCVVVPPPNCPRPDKK